MQSDHAKVFQSGRSPRVLDVWNDGVGSLVLYTRIPSITKHYMSELKLELTKVVTDMIPAKLDDVMPELPSATGPAVEMPKSPF